MARARYTRIPGLCTLRPLHLTVCAAVPAFVQERPSPSD
jgi:hypothetical protein